MFSAQTWTRSPRDTIDRVERATPHAHPERPQIEGRLKLDFHTGLEFDYEPFSLEMPSHFGDYKGGRIPGEALLDSAKRDFWKVGRLKSLVKHQDGSSPPATRDGPR